VDGKRNVGLPKISTLNLFSNLAGELSAIPRAGLSKSPHAVSIGVLQLLLIVKPLSLVTFRTFVEISAFLRPFSLALKTLCFCRAFFSIDVRSGAF